jgi:hypothetical protein
MFCANCLVAAKTYHDLPSSVNVGVEQTKNVLQTIVIRSVSLGNPADTRQSVLQRLTWKEMWASGGARTEDLQRQTRIVGLSAIESATQVGGWLSRKGKETEGRSGIVGRVSCFVEVCGCERADRIQKSNRSSRVGEVAVTCGQ